MEVKGADSTQAPAATPAIALAGISKRFGPVVANRDVDLTVAAGTVHALVGENGAGKSTLMKIAYGHVRADAGSISLKGHEIPIARHSPRRAIASGVGMVHQHFMLVPTLTVVENVVLGREPVRRGLLDLRRAARELRALGDRFGLAVDPDARVEHLSVGEQQRVEIVKVLWQGCDVVVLDEPTAVLTPVEVEQLFAVLRGLVEDGMTAILITHKLDEVTAIADRITVMRRGEVVAELDGRGASAEEIARAMVGRPVLLRVDKQPASPGEPALEISNLVARGRTGAPAVTIDALAVRAGEIVGVAGVEGNGQTELIEALCGLRPASGRITLAGRDAAPMSVAGRQDAGLCHVPEDRHARGLILELSVADNLVLGRQREFGRKSGLDRPRIRKNALALVERFDIRPPDPDAVAGQLSGGNQQKIVIARELSRPAPVVLVCAQPTRGVDIGAIETIHRAIIAARDDGLGVLLFSAELSEVHALSDRVVVLYRGRVAGELGAEELARDDALDRIGALMTGAGISAASDPAAAAAAASDPAGAAAAASDPADPAASADSGAGAGGESER